MITELAWAITLIAELKATNVVLSVTKTLLGRLLLVHVILFTICKLGK
jgi:hypothetical protein